MSLPGTLDEFENIRDNLRRIPVESVLTLADGSSPTSDFIPLWFGEGDLPPAHFAGAAIARALQAGYTFYTQQNGVTELRRTLAEYSTDLHGAPVTEERITVTAGGTGALMLALSLVVDRGDNVVTVDPVWPNVGGATRMLGGEVRSATMDLMEDGWSLDLGKLEAQLDRRTKAVFFASPGNPTGALIPIQTQRAMLEICRRRGIWIIADEVYNRIMFGRRAAPSILQIADPTDRVLVINSFSKAWAMTGWRLGWLLHPPGLGALFANMTMFSNSGQPTFLQHAAVTVIREGEPFVTLMNRYCEHGMQIVCDALQSMGRVRLRRRPEGAMYVFFEVDGMRDSLAACRQILRSAQVGLAPGAFFGANSVSFIRLCCCRKPEQLRVAMERLGPLLE